MNINNYIFLDINSIEIDIIKFIDNLLLKYNKFDIGVDSTIGNTTIHFMLCDESIKVIDSVHISHSLNCKCIYDDMENLIAKRKRLITLNMLDI